MRPLPREADEEYHFLLSLLRESSTFVFPEYFAFHRSLKEMSEFVDYSAFAFEWLKRLSMADQARETLLIGGSLLFLKDGKLLNATPVFFEGQLLGLYYKRRLFGHEHGSVTEGQKPLVVENPATQKKWGILICADVFLKDAFTAYENCDYIAVPTSSPWRPHDEDTAREQRDKDIFVKGARDSRSMILKCCSIGSVGTHNPEGGPPPRLQGRSLIANAGGVLERAPSIYWEGILQIDTAEQKTKTLYRETIAPHAE